MSLADDVLQAIHQGRADDRLAAQLTGTLLDSFADQIDYQQASPASLAALFFYLHRSLMAFGHRTLQAWNPVCIWVLDNRHDVVPAAFDYATNLVLRDGEFLNRLMMHFFSNPVAESIFQLLKHQCSAAPNRFLEQIRPFLSSSTKREALQLMFLMVQNKLVGYCHMQGTSLFSEIIRSIVSAHDMQVAAQGCLMLTILLSSETVLSPGDVTALFPFIKSLLIWQEPNGMTLPNQSRSNSVPAQSSSSRVSKRPERLSVNATSDGPSTVLTADAAYAVSVLFRHVYDLWPWESICFLRKESSKSALFRNACLFLVEDLPVLPAIIGVSTQRPPDSPCPSPLISSFSANLFSLSSPPVAPRSVDGPKSFADDSLWECKQGGMTLPSDHKSLKTAAQLLQNELIYERFQRRTLQHKLNSLQFRPRSDSSQNKFDKERAHFLGLIQHGRDELRQWKQQQRKWETDVLRRVDKLKTERSAVTERCLLIERSNGQLQSQVTSLQSELTTLRLQISKAREDVLVAEHNLSVQAKILQSTQSKVSSLNDELSKRRTLSSDTPSIGERVNKDNSSQIEEHLAQALKREGQASFEIQQLKKEVEELKHANQQHEGARSERQNMFNMQREFTKIQLQKLGERCESLKKINRLLQTRLICTGKLSMDCNQQENKQPI